MKRILVNSTHKEERRIVVVQDNWLVDVDIETSSFAQIKSNIYLGKVTRLEQSLDAVFVDYGAERNGFLPFKEIHPNYAEGDLPIREGRSVLVQVDKSERGNKGAALTTYIALAGKYLVFMPNSQSGNGISRRIDDEARRFMRDLLGKLPLEPNTSVIVRTAGVGRALHELQVDLDFLQCLWKKILAACQLQSPPQLVYSDNTLVTRLVRDYLQDDIDEIILDSEKLYDECITFVRSLSPAKRKKIVFYEDELLPLFHRFQIEEQLETIFQREVTLPSGGVITIDQTEALVAIDVNSSRSNRGAGIEETALNTNLEAADEIARQLRLRDIGGLVVIDFIDMNPGKNIRETETRLRTSLQNDRARVQTGRISRFGLLELSRQRLSSSLLETTTIQCPKCNGNGVIRTIVSASLAILRLIEQQACHEHTVQVRAKLPLAIATFLLNEKRDEFSQMEQVLDVSILLIPSNDMVAPSYEITQVMRDGKNRVLSLQSDLDNVNHETQHQVQQMIMQRMKPLVKHGDTAIAGSWFTRLLGKLKKHKLVVDVTATEKSQTQSPTQPKTNALRSGKSQSSEQPSEQPRQRRASHLRNGGKAGRQRQRSRTTNKT